MKEKKKAEEMKKMKEKKKAEEMKKGATEAVTKKIKPPSKKGNHLKVWITRACVYP